MKTQISNTQECQHALLSFEREEGINLKTLLRFVQQMEKLSGIPRTHLSLIPYYYKQIFPLIQFDFFC